MAKSSSTSRSKAQTGSGPAATLTQAQGMIQDYQQIMQPPVSNQMANAFFAVQHHPKHAKKTELVTVNPDNGLIWFYPSPSSNSGWAHEVSAISDAPEDSNGPIVPTALLPFYQRETLYVFAEYGNGSSGGVTTAQLLGMQWTESNGWAEANLSSTLRSILLQMTQSSLFFDEDGMGYLYGVTYSFSKQPTLTIIGVEPNGLELTNLYMGPASANTSYKLLPGTQKDQLVIMSLQGSTATFASAIKEDRGISLTGTTSSQDLGVGDLTADTVVPIARGSAPQPSFLLLSQAQSLYLVVGNGLDGSPAATATQITGGTNQPAALISITGGSEEDGGAFTAFALDAASNSLWTLTQTSSGGSYAWVPMGNIGIAIAAPQFLAGGPEMFLCSDTTIVSHITQRASTGSWFTLPIATPSPDTQPITETSSYSQQFTLTSTVTGLTMPKEVLSVYSNPAQVLVINSIAYNSSPTSPAIVQTDPSGSLTVTSAATGLASPILSVTGAALTGTPSTSYRGDLQVHQRIAGQGFSYNGQSLINGGVLPTGASTSDANELATNLQQLSGVAVNLGTGSSSSALKGSRRSSLMQISEGQLHCRQITQEEYAAMAGAADSVFTDAWGDFAHFCKQAWNDITQILITIAEDTANIAVTIYGAAKSFVLTTIDDIRDALEVILQWMAKLWNEIVNVIEKFIEFIKLLFDWNNILRTKEVVRYTVSQMFQNMQENTSDIQNWINAKITGLEGDIDEVFDVLESVFDPNLTFGAASKGPAAGPASSTAQQQAQANGVQYNYVISKSWVPLPAATAGTKSDTSYDPQSIWINDFLPSFWNAFLASEGTIEQDWDQIKSFAGQVDSLATFLDLVMLTFLETCQAVITAILNMIQAAIDTLLELMGDAVGYISAYLQRTIKIPVLSALYKLISGGDAMSVLDLFCFAVAVPATLSYEILHDTAPFSSADVTAITSSPIPWPWSGDFSSDTAIGPLASLALAPAAYQEIIGLIGGLGSLFYSLCDVYCDVANAAKQTGDEEGGEIITMASALGLGFNLIAMVFGAPWYAPSPSDSPASWATLATFAASLPPWIADVFYFNYQKELSRLAPGAGPWLSMAFGAIQTGCGVAETVMMVKDPGSTSYSFADETAGLLSGISNIGKPFAFLEEYGAVIMGAFDLVGDGGSFITDVIADIK